MPQCERDDGQRKHETRRHEFFGLHPAQREHDQQSHEQDVRDVRLKDDAQRTKGENYGEADGHVERDVALGFVISNHAADEQQHDVNPENCVR